MTEKITLYVKVTADNRKRDGRFETDAYLISDDERLGRELSEYFGNSVLKASKTVYNAHKER